MQTCWKHIKTIFDGDRYEINGLNIWDYNWDMTDETITVKDPLYGQTYSINIYKIHQTTIEVKFAAAEFSNGVWGIYQEQ